MCWGRESSSDSNDDEESVSIHSFLRIKNGTLTKNHVDSHSGITQQHIPIVHSLHGTSLPEQSRTHPSFLSTHLHYFFISLIREL